MSMVERVARALLASESNGELAWDALSLIDRGAFKRDARAAIEAMRDVENDTLAAGYEAMFVDKWDGTQAPMMGAGWDAMIDAALK